MVIKTLRAMAARILNADGSTVDSAALAEPQTARLTSLHHEFQGHPTRGLTPSRLAAITMGLSMLRDCRVRMAIMFCSPVA